METTNVNVKIPTLLKARLSVVLAEMQEKTGEKRNFQEVLAEAIEDFIVKHRAK